MSVVGFDFGNDSCYISIARAGGIETIVNDYSLRATPSYVAFGAKNRIMGVAAQNQLITNLRNTVFDFKRLLGRKFDDPQIQEEMKTKSYQIIKNPDGRTGIKVRYMNEDYVFLPERITGMLFTKLKEIAESALKAKVCDCVISVPSYFTDIEKRSLLASAEIAGLHVLCLLNETTATALSYGLYKQDLPTTQEKPRNVFFVDFGHSSLQVFACAFNQGHLKMIACAALSNVGGRNLDLILANHFAEEFSKKYHVDIRGNARAFLRLLTQMEKLKKQMSANSTELPFSLECLLEEKDVSGRMSRTEFENMASPLFQKIHNVMAKCLKDSGLTQNDIHSVEIVGGSSRLPAVKNIIKEVFGMLPSTTLNADESVARGCAIQCAILSPTFKVREFNIVDCQQYPIKLLWDGSHGEADEMEVFSKFDPVPFSKMLTFYRKQPFSLRAEYSGSIPHLENVIGNFVIKNVQPTSDGGNQKIKIKIRINSYGLFLVCRATIIELREIKHEDIEMNSVDAGNSQKKLDENKTLPNELTEQRQGTNQSQNLPNDADKTESDAKVEAVNEEKSDNKPKMKKIEIELPIEICQSGLQQCEILNYRDEEGKMAAQDYLEKERIDAKNAVEEYVYEMRGHVGNKLNDFLTSRDRDHFLQMLDDTEIWIYEEGEDCQKHVYVDKLNNLRKHGDPPCLRYQEFEARQHTINELGSSLQHAQKICDLYHTGCVDFEHLDDADVAKVEKAINEKKTWKEKQTSLLNRTAKHQDPPILASQFIQEKQEFERFAKPILNKPKPPKVEHPPKSEIVTDTPEQTGDGDKDNNSQTKKTEAMDVD